MTKLEILDCEQALRVLAAHLDGELDTITGAELERHLARCRSCYSRAEFEARLKASLARLGHEPVPGALSDRVARLIESLPGRNAE